MSSAGAEATQKERTIRDRPLGALTVALIGPDGAGKTTVSRALPDLLGMPVHYVYMGVNLEASTVMLPTTRLALELKRRRGARTDMVARSARGSSEGRKKSGPLKSAKSALRTVNWIAEEWYRQLIARRYLRQGGVVVFDRHFLPDYYVHDVTGTDKNRPFSSRLHGYFLKRYPRPDLAILLDAPAEVLFARKPESSIEFLEERRKEYRHLHAFARESIIVDASEPLDVVLARVAAAIQGAYERSFIKQAS